MDEPNRTTYFVVAAKYLEENIRVQYYPRLSYTKKSFAMKEDFPVVVIIWLR